MVLFVASLLWRWQCYRFFTVLKYFLFLLFICTLVPSYSQKGSEKILIKNIVFAGNRKTRERIIRREMSLQEGDRFTKTEIDSIFVWDQNRIYNTNLFNSVTLSLTNEAEDNSEADVKVTLDERWYLYPIPFVKLIDRNLSDWWVNRDRDLSRINYGIRLAQFNFRGRGETLRVIMQSGFTTGMNIRYWIPNLDKKQNHGLFIGTSYSQARNVAFNTVRNIPRFTFDSEEILRRVYFNRARHTYRSSFYTFHSTTLGHYHVQIADTLAALNENYLAGDRTAQSHFYFGHSFRYDKRDNVNYTLHGTRFSVGLIKYGLGIYRDGVDYWLTALKAAKHWDLRNNWYAAADVSALSTFPRRRDYFNFYRIGVIPETLRGYDLTVVEGSAYVIQRNEVKYKVIGKQYDISSFMPVRQFQTFPLNVFWKVFYDHGYVQGYPNYTGSEPLSDTYLYSFGTGIDLVLVNDITMRFELSRNAQRQNYFFLNFIALI